MNISELIQTIDKLKEEVTTLEGQITSEEPKYTIKIKQTAKGFSYFEAGVKGNTKEEIKQRLNEVTEIAEERVAILNSKKQEG